tara:strand:- start:673 stop:1464 length:792 start_codon:yes stop_codon:yes gene_type:complete
MTGWLPAFEKRLVYNRGFPRRPQVGMAHLATVRKLVLHTTEGTKVSSAFAAYDRRAGFWSGGVHPHFTVDPLRRQLFQHVPVTAASYSLKGGDQGGIIQIEIVGSAGESHLWPLPVLDWLGSAVVAPIFAAVPTIPAVAPAEFLGADAGLLAAPWPRGRARISPEAWPTTYGVLGHQHSPPDDHWDPGKLDIDALLSAAEQPETDEDQMQTLIDSTTGEHWVAAAGKARPLHDPDAWMASWVGPTCSSANMKYVISALYEVVS